MFALWVALRFRNDRSEVVSACSTQGNCYSAKLLLVFAVFSHINTTETSIHTLI